MHVKYSFIKSKTLKYIVHITQSQNQELSKRRVMEIARTFVTD